MDDLLIPETDSDSSWYQLFERRFAASPRTSAFIYLNVYSEMYLRMQPRFVYVKLQQIRRGIFQLLKSQQGVDRYS